MSHLVTLGTTDGPGALASLPVAVVRDGRGRFYVTTPEQGTAVPFIYDPEGRFVARLGREGEGPGEYLRPAALVVGPGDTLHIFDRTANRLTVVSPSYGAVRTALVPGGGYDALVLEGVGYVINRTGAGLPLQLLDPLGTPLMDFGAPAPVAARDQSWRNARVLARSSDGRIWSGHRYFALLFELWDIRGRRLKTLTIDADWFPQYDTLWNATTELSPMPTLTDIWVEGDSCLWILGQAPDPSWRDALGTPLDLEGQRVYPITDRQRAYDVVIEVIDVSSGRPVAMRRLDHGYIGSVVAPGMIATRRETEDGWWLVDIWEVDLNVPVSGSAVERCDAA